MTGRPKTFVPKGGPPVPVDQVHHYQPRPGPWPTKEPPCAVCEGPKGSRRHDVAEVPEEAREIDARRLGEGTDE